MHYYKFIFKEIKCFEEAHYTKNFLNMMIGKQKETSCYKYVYYRGLKNTYELAFYKLVINKSSEHKEIVKYLSEFFSN